MMLKHITIIIIAIFYLLFPRFVLAEMRGLPNITVLSASSLTYPMLEIIRHYSRLTNTTITTDFDATSELARKIEEGESADVFISSHPHWMQALKQQGLIDVYTLTNLVRNRLSLVSNTDNPLIPSLFQQSLPSQLNYLFDRTIMIVGDPNNTALGSYTKEAFTALEEQLQLPLLDKLNYQTMKATGSTDIKYLIANGNKSGIIFYSDAHNNENIFILSVFAEQLHSPIIYQAAVVAGENMVLARDFLEFLKSKTAMDIFKKYSFIIDNE